MQIGRIAVMQITMSTKAAELTLHDMRMRRNDYLKFWTDGDGRFDGDITRLLEYTEACEEIALALENVRTK